VPHILATPAGQRLGELAARLTRKPVWVRHDEHIHIDFTVGP
jgi:penicillin-insensitive murein endopeptidase